MPWLTHLIKTRLVSSSGERVGRVLDLVAARGRYPRVVALKVKLTNAGRDLFGRDDREVSLSWEGISLSLTSDTPRAFHVNEPLIHEDNADTELHLRHALLDRQIVDIDGARVVRVNDLALSESTGGLTVVGADVGFSGVLRQLGLEPVVGKILGALGYNLRERLISWNYMAPVEHGPEQVRLVVSNRLLKELHPGELADILDQLEPPARETILQMMSAADLALTLPETEEKVSREAIALLSEERVRTVVDLMPEDEAADLLGVIGYERSERLLGMMGIQRASVLRSLLGYPPDTAGGRMTTSFVGIAEGSTVSEAIGRIRAEAQEVETVYYAYVLDGNSSLVGILSLRGLLRAAPDRRVEALMETDVVTVHASDDQQEVARAISRYNLMAMPVVDDGEFGGVAAASRFDLDVPEAANPLKSHGRMLGIVTVDDVIDVFQEEASEDLGEVAGVYLGQGTRFVGGRLGGFLLSILAGAVGAALLEKRRSELLGIAAVAWLLPMYIRVSTDLGTWSLARALVASRLERQARLDAFAQELLAALAGAGFTGVLVGLFAGFWTKSAGRGVFLGVGIFVGSLAASVMGLLLPTLVRKARLGGLLGARAPAILVGLAGLIVYVWALNSLAGRF